MKKQTIIIGDCLVALKDMQGASIDCCTTSPPFNLNINYNSYKDNLPRDQYLNWMREVSAALCRVLKPDGSLFLNVGSSNIDPWIAHDVSNVFRADFVLQNHIIWAKSISVRDDTFGHFKPINSKRFLNHIHESIFHYTKSGDVPIDRLAVGVEFKDKSNIARRGHAQDKRCGGDIWWIPYETVKSKAQKFNHPAGFPIELARRCIKLHGATPDTVVLDPFLGAGTTLVAAAELGCAGFGIELDAEYAAIAQARLEALQAA
jgi:site-specific DNA-methyltransferase (adenine-specific)